LRLVEYAERYSYKLISYIDININESAKMPFIVDHNMSTLFTDLKTSIYVHTLITVYQ